MIDLSTEYLGMTLKNPLVPSASPLARDLDTPKRLEDAGAAALVMDSLFEEEIVHDLRELAGGSQVSDLLDARDRGEESRSAEYLERLYHLKEELSIPVIASLNCDTHGAWVRFAAMFEEVFSRAFLLGGLLVLLRDRKWLAIIISAIFFGLAHLANPNASVLSVFGNFLGGIMYGIAFVESGRIWLAFGLHFAWNFVQGPILGFMVSGIESGGIIHQVTTGSDLVTGGAYGPEAGLVGIAFRFVVFAMLYGWFSWQRKKDT